MSPVFVRLFPSIGTLSCSLICDPAAEKTGSSPGTILLGSIGVYVYMYAIAQQVQSSEARLHYLL